MNCLAVGIGGFVGAIGRYLLSFVSGYYFLEFPLGTMLINLTGAFCIGFIAGITPLGVLSEQQQLFFKTGLCGGFTTFSTFSLESVTLLQRGRTGLALAYMALSAGLCLAGVLAGQWLSRRGV